MEKSTKRPLSAPNHEDIRASSAPLDYNNRRRRRLQLRNRRGHNVRRNDNIIANKMNVVDSGDSVSSPEKKINYKSVDIVSRQSPTAIMGPVARLDGILSSLLQKRGKFALQHDEEQEEKEVFVRKRAATADDSLGKGQSSTEMNLFGNFDTTPTCGEECDLPGEHIFRCEGASARQSAEESVNGLLGGTGSSSAGIKRRETSKKVNIVGVRQCHDDDIDHSTVSSTKKKSSNEYDNVKSKSSYDSLSSWSSTQLPSHGHQHCIHRSTSMNNSRVGISHKKTHNNHRDERSQYHSFPVHGILFYPHSSWARSDLDLTAWVPLLAHTDKNNVAFVDDDGRKIPISGAIQLYEANLKDRVVHNNKDQSENKSYNGRISPSDLKRLDNRCKDGFQSVTFYDSTELTDEVVDMVTYDLALCLTRLSMKYCRGISDKALLTIARNCRHRLKALRITGCHGVTDEGVRRFLSSSRVLSSNLQNLSFCGCKDLNDRTVSTLANNCPNLQVLDLSYCTSLTDKALVSIVDANGGRLTSTLLDVILAGCHCFTDVGLTELLAACSSIQKLDLSSCNRLTDKSIKTIYEIEVLYGSRINHCYRGLLELCLNDMTYITGGVILWVSRSCPILEVLSLKNGQSVSFDEPLSAMDAFSGLASLGRLRTLVLSGCYDLPAEPLHVFFSKSASSLTLQYLDVSGIPSLTDGALCVALDRFIHLKELHVGHGNMVTVQSIRHLRKTLLTLDLSGLHLPLAVSAVHTLSGLMLNLVRLNLSENPFLESSSFQYLDRLTRLEFLNVSACPLLDDAALKWTPRSALREIRADYLPRLTDQGVDILCCRQPNLTHLSLQFCVSVTLQTAKIVAKSCSNLVKLCLTGTDRSVTYDALHEILNEVDASCGVCSLTTVVKFDKEENKTKYLGLALDPYIRDEQLREAHYRYFTNAICSVQLIQRSYRNYRRERELQMKKKRIQRSRRRWAICVLRRFIHYTLERLSRRRKHQAEVTIALILQASFMARRERGIRKKLARSIFSVLKTHVDHSREAYHCAEEYHAAKMAHRIIRAFSRNIAIQKNLPPSKREVLAIKYWRGKIYRKIWITWRTEAIDTKLQRKKNALRFILVTDLRHHNSLEQLRLYSLAKKKLSLRTFRIVWVGWLAFCDYCRREQQRMAKATKFAESRNKSKCSSALQRIKYNALSRQQMMLRRIDATLFVRHRRGRECLNNLSTFVCYKQEEQAMRHSVVHFLCTRKRRFLTRKAVEALLQNKERALFRKEQDAIAMRAWTQRKSLEMTKQLRAWIASKADMVAKYKSSTSHHNQVLARRLYTRLVLLKHQKVKSTEAVFRQICKTRKERMFIIWSSVWWEKSEATHRANMQQQRMHLAATRLQSINRGQRARRNADEWATFRDWAVLLCQRQARVYLSRRKRSARERIVSLQQHLRETNEEDKMGEEDAQLQHFYFTEKIVIEIQRNYRGRYGRLHSLQLLQQFCKDVVADFKDTKRKQLLFSENQEQRKVLETEKKIQTAIFLQRIIRGFFGRKRYAAALLLRSEIVAATKLQSIIRGRHERQRDAARRRHHMNLERLRIAKASRTGILNFFGIRTLRSRNLALAVTKSLGLDLVEFVGSLSQQRGEILSDYKDAGPVLRQFIQNLRRTRLNLSEWLQTDEVDWVPPSRDTIVRIIKDHHRYTGMTGQVLHVIRTSPDYEIAIRMDFDRKTVKIPLVQHSTVISRGGYSCLSIANVASYDELVQSTTDSSEKCFLKRLFHDEREQLMIWKAALCIQCRVRSFLAIKLLKFMRYKSFSSSHVYRLAKNDTASQLGINTSAMKSFFKEQFPTREHLLYPRLEKKVLSWVDSNLINIEYRLRKRESKSLKVVNSYFSGRKRKARLTKNDESLDELLSISRTPLDEEDAHIGRSVRCRKSPSCTKILFSQLKDSPHVRAGGLALYCGSLEKVILSAGIFRRPHGCGYAEFIQGLGCGKDDKTLTIKVCRARDLLAADFARNADPFVTVQCNHQVMKTSIKKNTLDPVWGEVFQFHVSDPNHIVRISVYDRGRFSRNDLLGCVSIKLATITSEKPTTMWHSLMDYGINPTAHSTRRKDSNRLGMIELEVVWKRKSSGDEKMKAEKEREASIILQRWVRMKAAQSIQEMSMKVLNKQFHHYHKNAIIIECAFRQRWSRRRYVITKARRDSAVRLQCFVRTRRACWRVAIFKKRHISMIIIQCMFRSNRARYVLRELRHIRTLLMYYCAASIQRLIRWHLAVRCRRHREKLVENTFYSTLTTINEWLPTYGRDADYGSKRLKRIATRVFNKILRSQGRTLVTIYGEVYVDIYPAPHLKSRSDHDMVQVTLLGCKPLSIPREEKDTILAVASRYNAVISISAVCVSETICWHLCIIQSFFRSRLALNVYNILRCKKKVALFLQHFFRLRHSWKTNLALALQKISRGIKARRNISDMIIRANMALVIQLSFRCYKSRCALERQRRIDTCIVIESSGSVDGSFDATKTIDERDDTFWCSKNDTSSNHWILYDLQQPKTVGTIDIKTIDNTSSPREIRLESLDETCGRFSFVSSIFPIQSTAWQKVVLENITCSRVWKLSVIENFGNSEAVTICGVRFIQAKEVSPYITDHPTSIILSPGPDLFEQRCVKLCCKASGLPKPTYQWLKDGVPLQGETNPVINVCVEAHVSRKSKTFQCVRCKRANSQVPENVNKVFCSYCKKNFDFPEVFRYSEERQFIDDAMQKVEGISEDLEARKKTMQRYIAEKLLKVSKTLSTKCSDRIELENEDTSMMSETYRKYQNDLSMTPLKHGLKELENLLSNTAKLRMRILEEKRHCDPFKLQYNGEGKYQCVVKNVRCGTLSVSAISTAAIVYVADPEHQKIKCNPVYLPRDNYLRTSWPKYSALYANFQHGLIKGEVHLKFDNGDQYFGPYSNNSIDYNAGEGADCITHLGIWKSADGTLYEGSTVDTYFDKLNMNGKYIVKWKNGEAYEGGYVDGKRHGYGKFRFCDGSIYQGDWFQGKRQGLGELKKSNGSFYKGEWDNDQIHGEGNFYWQEDGSSYIGETVRGARSGRGVYSDNSGNIYDGFFSNNQMHGKGTFKYVNGEIYEGPFRENKREGQAILTCPSGEVYIGAWKNDMRDGIFIVERKINDSGIVAKEVLVSRWKEGKLVAWEDSLIDPKVTSQFHDRWKSGGEKLNSPYAADVVRKLPFLPRGVDGSQPATQRILKQIAQKNIEVICADSYIETKEKLNVISKEIADMHMICLHLEGKLAQLRNEKMEHCDTLNIIQSSYDDLRFQQEDLKRSIDVFWEGDCSRAKQKFAVACEELKHIHTKDWFKLRRYHEPPQFIAKLLSAVCSIMQWEDSWEMSKILLGSSKNNRDKGDEDSIWQHYDVKLLFLLYGSEIRQDIKDSSSHSRTLYSAEFKRKGIKKLQGQTFEADVDSFPSRFDVFCLTKNKATLSKLSAFFDDPMTRDRDCITDTFGSACLALISFVEASEKYIRKACEIEVKNEKLLKFENLAKHKLKVLGDARNVMDSFNIREKAMEEELQHVKYRRTKKTKEEGKLDCIMAKCLSLMTDNIGPMESLTINSDQLIFDFIR